MHSATLQEDAPPSASSDVIPTNWPSDKGNLAPYTETDFGTHSIGYFRQDSDPHLTTGNYKDPRVLSATLGRSRDLIHIATFSQARARSLTHTPSHQVSCWPTFSIDATRRLQRIKQRCSTRNALTHSELH